MKGVFIITFLLLSLSSIAQEEESFNKKVNISFLLGYQVGGQGENRNFVTKNGPSAQLGIQYSINKLIQVGAGAGILDLDQELFFPLFLGIKAKFNEEQNGQFLRARLGYSFAEDKEVLQFDSYDFDGGLYFTTGWGYQWGLFKNLLLDIELNIEFQSASLEFTSFSGEAFEDDIQNYFLSFKTGINF